MNLSSLNVAGASAASTGATPAAGAASNDPNGQDRFLKMLVAQMKNQDPLNPLDNAQVTSQMAQINTVTGIERLNGSVQAMLSQLTQTQALGSAALIGRDVLVEGSRMHLDAGGSGRAAIELAGPASRVTVELLGSGGQVLDSFELGPLDAGRHHFAWQSGSAALAGSTVNYRVTAAQGQAAVGFVPYTRETVGAISPGAHGIELDLVSGSTIPYSKARSVA
ncbi:flagellar hook assembly protein FlgD [Caldimonas tepidiphila]|uniref:flagellar hook assembly protein FlgD n=1 Tax=Caldimonas tepidiphila TaxID=2315841 RepID=UPI000E5A8455|nr:flagellar hook capping FlgD N-terminal domain-containing protein [Caldimonas tepidiphila]